MTWWERFHEAMQQTTDAEWRLLLVMAAVAGLGIGLAIALLTGVRT